MRSGNMKTIGLILQALAISASAYMALIVILSL
jgi:hypothetical protein